jgi:hypothetical protein
MLPHSSSENDWNAHSRILMLNHSSGLRSRTSRDDAGPSGPGSIGRLEKEFADNGPGPKYIGSVSIANGQDPNINMPWGRRTGRFGNEIWRGSAGMTLFGPIRAG